MISYLWLSRFILLSTVASPSLSNLFDLEINSFWNDRAPDIEALDFFHELEKDDHDLRGSQRSGVTNVDKKATVKKPTKSTKKHHLKRRRGGSVAAAKRDVTGESIDNALEGIVEGLLLSDITGDMFNGQEFVMESDIEEGDDRIKLTANLQTDSLSIPLPGGDIVFEQVDGKDALVVKVSSSDPSFEATVIKMEGKAYFSNLQRLTADIVIEKPADSEIFEITKFDVSGQSINILDILGDVELFNTLKDLNLKDDYIDKLKNELKAFTGFGAFTRDTLQLVIHLDGTSSITKAIGATSISFIIAQNGEKTPRQFSVFVTIPDFIQNLGKLFDQKDLFTSNFFLKYIGGEVCLFLVGSDIEYLDPIKADERLTACFGDQEEAKAEEAFAVVEAGLHANLRVNFKEALEKGCWNDKDDKPADLGETSTEVRIYATITRSGVDCNFLSDATISTNIILACFNGLMEDAPEYLKNGHITLRQLTRVKVEEDGKTKKHWRIGVSLTPGEGFNTLPGTSIRLTNFDLDAEGYADSWNVEATLKTQIGSESNLDLSIVKEGSEYYLEARSSKLTLGDLLSAFSIPGVDDTNSQGMLSILGVKDFLFSMKFGKDLPEYEFVINGKPLIFGFDRLEIAAIIVKKKSGGSRKKKAAVAKRSSRGKKSGGGLKYTIGLYLNGADFTPLMKNVFNRDDIDLQWLGGLKAIVVFTNDAGNVMLKYKEEEERKGKKKMGKLAKRHTKVGKNVKMINKEAASATNGTTHSLPQVLPTKKFMREKRDDDEEEEVMRELQFDQLHEELQDREIGSPITFAIIWTIPTEAEIDTCHDNPLCKWMATNLRSSNGATASISIIGELGGGVFKLKAVLSMEVNFIDKPDEKLTFTGMTLGIEVGADVPQVEISATMDYENSAIGATGDNKLTFTGAIAATPISMSLLFTMENFIFPKFGGDTAYIGIGDITLGGGYSGGLPSFTFGVAIKLGLFDNPPESDHGITIRGNFGISVGNPEDNWVYGSISALTIGAVCTAFRLKCDSMPDKLKNTGFPYGISASFSNEEREVLGVGTIPQGLQIKGTLSIFGFECHTELSIAKGDDGYEFAMLIEMSPLDWGNGMIQVSRSRKDKENGPIASAKISTSSPQDFEFCIEGYANLLSIMEMGVRIKITAEMFDFHIEGYLIPAFLHASIDITARYGGGGDSNDPLFSFKATVSARFSEKLKQIIIDFMMDLQKKVSAAMDAAKAELDKAMKKVDDAKKEIESWKNSIESWKKDLQKRRDDLEKEMQPPPCDCPDVCFAFFDWDSHCWKIWGYWVGCPWWNSCFRMIDDIFCKAGCLIVKIITTIIRWAKQAILSIGILIASGVQGLLTLGQGILDLAKGVLTIAKRVVDFAKSVINGALQLAVDALLAILENFRLNELTLTASLSADYSACVGYKYDLVFFGKNQKGSGEACLDLKSLSGSLIGGVTENEEQTKGTTKTPERLKEINSESREVKSAEDELEAEEGDAKARITDETSQEFNKPEKRDDIPTLKKWARTLEKVPRHHTAPTHEEMEIIKLANKKIPRYEVKGDPVMRKIVKRSPWELPLRHIPIGHNETVRREETETGQKRTLDFDSNLTPCRRMKRALQGYSDLTNGIIKYSQAVQQSTNAMKKSKIANTEKLDEFQRNLQVAELKHNMTAEDKEDAYYVYNNLAHRHDELVRKSQTAAYTEDAYAMPIIRRQINHLLEKEKGSTFMRFTDIMHLNAVDGYKRSQIPHPADIQGEQILGNIKQGLQAIVTNEDSALTPMTSRLQNVKMNIIAMSDYVKQCRDN